VTFAAFKEIPWNIFGSLAACRSQITFRTPFLDNAIVALAYQAPDELRTSSLPALHLVERNNPRLSVIPTDMGLGEKSPAITRLLRRLFCKATFKLDYFSNEGMPHLCSSLDPMVDHLHTRRVLFGHHKFLRYRRWFRKELAGYLREVTSSASQQNGFWKADALKRAVEQHISGRKNYTQELNTILTLEAVERLLIRNTPTPEKVVEPSFSRDSVFVRATESASARVQSEPVAIALTSALPLPSTGTGPG
jgi:asparagine synthase (glutamine-hydrolysing)